MAYTLAATKAAYEYYIAQ